MKHSLLLLLLMGVALSLTTGCRNRGTKVTPLPTGTTGTTGSARPAAPDLSTAPVNINGPGTAGVTGEAAVDPNALPDDSKLAGRPEDRSRFAAQSVYFELDRSAVRTEEAAKIDQVASAFKALPADHDLLIEGHCDERGTEEYNRALGERRALAIRELLVKSGVDAARVHTKSLGEDRPANPAHDEEAWSKNRRGEFVLVLPKNSITTQNTQ
jgi:peptidoglycan-associated lipoprotein